MLFACSSKHQALCFVLACRAMYVLLFLQFTSSTFYDPARRALEPKLVPKKQLHLATTLDTFAWSVTVAVGSSLGGAVVSKLGTTMCFVLDSCTFLCAALCVLLLQVRCLCMCSIVCTSCNGPCYSKSHVTIEGAALLLMAHLNSSANIRHHMCVFHMVAYVERLSVQYCSMHCCLLKAMLSYLHHWSEACPACAANAS